MKFPKLPNSPRSRKKGFSKALIVGSSVVGLIIFCGFIYAKVFFKLYKVPTVSNEPTIHAGDRIFARLGPYNSGMPTRGDLVVFRYPRDPEIDYIKRVIAIEGDTISFEEDGSVALNGTKIPQTPIEDADLMAQLSDPELERTIVQEELDGKPYLTLRIKNGLSALQSQNSQEVPKGHFFVLGDSRDNSTDSRTYGPIPVENIIGRPEVVLINLNSWNRFFHALD